MIRLVSSQLAEFLRLGPTPASSDEVGGWALSRQAVGSNPIRDVSQGVYGPKTSFTERSEDIVYTLGPKGLFSGCRVFSSRSM